MRIDHSAEGFCRISALPVAQKPEPFGPHSHMAFFILIDDAENISGPVIAQVADLAYQGRGDVEPSCFQHKWHDCKTCREIMTCTLC